MVLLSRFLEVTLDQGPFFIPKDLRVQPHKEAPQRRSVLRSPFLLIDPHVGERRFLRLIPTSMKTARAGPPAGPLSRPLAGQLQPGSLPTFVSPPPPPSPPSCWKAASLPGLSPPALGRTKRDSAPNLGGGGRGGQD